jgi:flagellar hook protein FlgE
MMRTLLAGLSGLRSHQVRMDVIGDNIANANTIGFKASRVSFRETFAEKLLAGAASGSGVPRALEVGTGSGVGSIGSIFTQGALESTGRPLDLAIQGNGLFVVRNGDQFAYTRAGDFEMDTQGHLLVPGVGAFLQGVTASADGTVGAPSSIGDLVIPIDAVSAARATSEIRIGGNLDAAAAAGTTRVIGATAYDASGQAHDIRMTFTNVSPGSWTWKASCDGVDMSAGTEGTATFDANGALTEFTYPDGASGLTLTTSSGGSISLAVLAEATGDGSGITSLAGSSTASARSQNGRMAGSLAGVSIDQTGTIIGTFTNGATQAFGQIALATFHNPDGLTRTGDGLYAESADSGEATLGFALGGSGTAISSGALENSTVDITQEFSDMIITQRGFQASARIVQTADEMLNEIVSLLR